MEATGEIVVEVTSRVQKRVDGLDPNKVHYPTEDVVGEIPDGVGLRIDIPRSSIYGRQIDDEYSQDKSLRVIKALEDDPEGYLRREPILVCLVPKSLDESVLVIVDGHHRFRESGRVIRIGVSGERQKVYSHVPSIVFTPAEMADLLNKSGHFSGGLPYTEEILTSSLLLEAAEAEQDFASRMPGSKQQIPLKGVASVQDLPQAFALRP